MRTRCLQGFVNQYPDVRIDQLVNLLLIRGDLNRSDAKQVSCTLDIVTQVNVMLVENSPLMQTLFDCACCSVMNNRQFLI